MHWGHPAIAYPAVAAAASFAISTALSDFSALRRYDEAINAGRVPPHKSPVAYANEGPERTSFQ